MRIFAIFGPTLVLVPLLAVGLVACTKPVPTEDPVRAVKLLTVQTGKMQSESEFAGEVRARTELRLGFRVPGKLVRRQAEVGQRVKSGDVLAQLDQEDFKLAIDTVQAQLDAATTNRDLADDVPHLQGILFGDFYPIPRIGRLAQQCALGTWT